MTSSSTRWTIIRGAAEGKEAERAEFARHYGPVIRAYLRARWRNTPLMGQVDDASQQVFIDCFREDGALGRADPDRESGFGAFLYGVVRNVARAVERKHARTKEQQAASGLLERVLADEDSLAQVYDRAWATALMRDAASLHMERAQAAGPDAVRRHRLLSLRYGENRPIREIAAEWGVEAEQLHREATKARREFRAALMDVLRELHGPKGIEEECDRLFAAFSE